MATRANLGIVAWIGIIIVVGLIVTHGKGAQGETNAALGGIRNIISTLESPEKQTGH